LDEDHSVKTERLDDAKLAELITSGQVHTKFKKLG
jgi:hypothetical protein